MLLPQLAISPAVLFVGMSESTEIQQASVCSARHCGMTIFTWSDGLTCIKCLRHLAQALLSCASSGCQTRLMYLECYQLQFGSCQRIQAHLAHQSTHSIASPPLTSPRLASPRLTSPHLTSLQQVHNRQADQSGSGMTFVIQGTRGKP